MCNCQNNGMGINCCAGRPGYHPTICVRDLSRTNQNYLQLAGARGAVSAQLPGSNHDVLFDMMTSLSVTHCIKLDPCCTSGIAFNTAQGLIEFLANNNFVPGQQDAQIRQQKFLKGQYTCGQMCC